MDIKWQQLKERNSDAAPCSAKNWTIFGGL